MPDFSEHSPETWTTARGARVQPPLPPLHGSADPPQQALRPAAYQVGSDADLPAVAQEIAHNVDDGLAGRLRLPGHPRIRQKERPDLQNIPIVMMGFSRRWPARPPRRPRPRPALRVVLIGGGTTSSESPRRASSPTAASNSSAATKRPQSPPSNRQALPRRHQTRPHLHRPPSSPTSPSSSSTPPPTPRSLQNRRNPTTKTRPPRPPHHARRPRIPLLLSFPGRKALIADSVERPSLKIPTHLNSRSPRCKPSLGLVLSMPSARMAP